MSFGKIVDHRQKAERREMPQRDIPIGTTFEADSQGLFGVYFKFCTGAVVSLAGSGQLYVDSANLWMDYRPVNVELHILPEEGGERPAADPNDGAVEALIQIEKYASRIVDSSIYLREIVKMLKRAVEVAVVPPVPSRSV